MKSNNFKEIYKSVLWDLYNRPDYVVHSSNSQDKERQSGYRELAGYQFKLTNIYNNMVDNNARGFNPTYARDFFNYVMTGEVGNLASNPRAVEYLAEFEGRNTQYGPRIREQLPAMLEELVSDIGTRRAVILILNADDQELLTHKSRGKTKIEYPCTNSLTFSIRDNRLNLVSNMRSQSAALVMPYDIYNWTHLMIEVKDMLHETYPTLECGTLTHQIASLHYFNSEEPLVKSILAEYGMLV